MMKRGKFNLLVFTCLIFIVIALTLYCIPDALAQRPLLYWGSRGSDVRVLQRKLYQWGYYEGTADGVFGTDTALAVRDFQRKNRLRVDGVVGPETWAALGYRGVSVTGGRNLVRRTRGTVNRNDSVEIIARLIHAEARAEPYEGQVAVAAVLLNRVDSPKFPNSISGVIYQPLAFESVANGQFNLPPNDENRKAARSAINGWDPTHGSLFFWNPSKPVSRWIWSRRIVRRIGGHVFAH